ncbi:MAG TPA: hypothetical protein VI199_07225 [Novosphingobium sp.]
MTGDRLVALLGLVMALVLVSRSGAYRRLSVNRRLAYGTAWAVIIGVAAAIAARLAR